MNFFTFLFLYCIRETWTPAVGYLSQKSDVLQFHLSPVAANQRSSLQVVNYTYNDPIFDGIQYHIFNMKERLTAWLDAEKMCKNALSAMISSHTSESLEEIMILIKQYPKLYLYPTLVFLNIFRKKKVGT